MRTTRTLATILVAWLCFGFPACAAYVTARSGGGLWRVCEEQAKIEKIKKKPNGWINACMHATLEGRGGKEKVLLGEKIALVVPVGTTSVAVVQPGSQPVAKSIEAKTAENTIPAATHIAMTKKLSGQLNEALDQRDSAARLAISERTLANAEKGRADMEKKRADDATAKIPELQTKVRELEARPAVAPTTSEEARQAMALHEEQLTASKKLADERQVEINRLTEVATADEGAFANLRMQYINERVVWQRRVDRAEVEAALYQTRAEVAEFAQANAENSHHAGAIRYGARLGETLQQHAAEVQRADAAELEVKKLQAVKPVNGLDEQARTIVGLRKEVKALEGFKGQVDTLRAQVAERDVKLGTKDEELRLARAASDHWQQLAEVNPNVAKMCNIMPEPAWRGFERLDAVFQVPLGKYTEAERKELKAIQILFSATLFKDALAMGGTLRQMEQGSSRLRTNLAEAEGKLQGKCPTMETPVRRTGQSAPVTDTAAGDVRYQEWNEPWEQPPKYKK